MKPYKIINHDEAAATASILARAERKDENKYNGEESNVDLERPKSFAPTAYDKRGNVMFGGLDIADIVPTYD